MPHQVLRRLNNLLKHSERRRTFRRCRDFLWWCKV